MTPSTLAADYRRLPFYPRATVVFNPRERKYYTTFSLRIAAICRSSQSYSLKGGRFHGGKGFLNGWHYVDRELYTGKNPEKPKGRTKSKRPRLRPLRKTIDVPHPCFSRAA